MGNGEWASAVSVSRTGVGSGEWGMGRNEFYRKVGRVYRREFDENVNFGSYHEIIRLSAHEGISVSASVELRL